MELNYLDDIHPFNADQMLTNQILIYTSSGAIGLLMLSLVVLSFFKKGKLQKHRVKQMDKLNDESVFKVESFRDEAKSFTFDQLP